MLTPDHPEFWDPAIFLPNTKIRTKSGAIRKFDLWDHQKILAAAVRKAYKNKKWLVHVKPRQEGSSTFFTGVVVQHVCFRTGCQAAILAHKKGTAQALANIAIRAHRHLPSHLRPKKTSGLKRQLEIPSLDSRLEIAGVKDEEPLRGETVQVLLATEIASWSGNAGPEAWASALSTVSDDYGFVIGESTPKHHGDELHQVCMDAERPGSRWVKVFIPWTMINEYQTEPPPGWKPNALVRGYLDTHPGISTEQAVWMQKFGLPKCRNDLNKFQAEYPVNEIECWVLAGDSVYDQTTLLGMLEGRDLGTGLGFEEEDLVLFEPPNPDHRYIITCDPAGSWAKRDRHGVHIIDVNECKQVGEFWGHGEAFKIAKMLVNLAKDYNNARLYIEANGIGESVISHVLAKDYRHLFFRKLSRRGGGGRAPGWYTTVQSKAQAEGYLQELILDGSLTIRSTRCIRQLLNYRGQWSKLGRDEGGGHYDLASSMAIAAWAWRAEAGSSVKNNTTRDPNEVWRRLLAKIDRPDRRRWNSKYGEHM